MPRVKKKVEQDALNAVEAKVKANPRGAPETIRADDGVPPKNASNDSAGTLSAPPAPRPRPCALEDAPVGSKVVVGLDADGRKQARLITPNESLALPETDLASSLPLRAKVRRRMMSLFEASQLNGSTKVYVASTAADAIAQYRNNFPEE